METVKIINIYTNVIKEVSKPTASDYIGTKEWKIYNEKVVEEKETIAKRFNKEEK